MNSSILLSFDDIKYLNFNGILIKKLLNLIFNSNNLNFFNNDNFFRALEYKTNNQ